MTDRTVDLDGHRGMAAQKATELRRLRVEVQTDQAALQAREEALELMLAAAPASGWPEAVEKARYLLGLFARTGLAEDPRRRRLIAAVLSDFDRLLGEPELPAPASPPGSLQGRAGTGDEPMAEGEPRGNREAREPKDQDPAAAAPASPFAASGEPGDTPRRPGGKT